MKPDSQAPSDLLPLLRQQLLLAQVRLMELEDERDELLPRLKETDALLAAAQVLADRQTDAAGHLEKVRAGLQVEFQHLQHQQHLTNEALNAVRAELAAASARETALLAETARLETLSREQADTVQRQAAQVIGLESQVHAAGLRSAAQLDRIAQLDGELRVMKSSRSWRWTAWLRSLERLFR